VLCRDASYSSGADLRLRQKNVVDRNEAGDDIPTMIVTYRHRRKRPAKPAQAATIVVPRIVQITPKGGAWMLPAPLEPDPEADAKVRAFFDRMIKPRG
jgi:hypothetical protein